MLRAGTFARSQVSSFVGGMTDYLIMIALTEYVHIHYTISVCISGTLGAVLNFSVNRYWTFRAYQANHDSLRKQLVKFSLVAASSIVLKSSGTWLLTTYWITDYKISRILTDVLVAIGFNYILQTYWVFRKVPLEIMKAE